MAILDIHDLGLAREQGRDIVGVMAFVQRPLAAVLAQPAIRSPQELEGKRAGVSGLPSDEAVLRSVVAGDGGDPEHGAQDDDRLPGGQGAAGRPRRRRDRVLERRGRRAARAAARDPRVPRRRLRRAALPGAGAGVTRDDAGGRRAGRARDDPRAAARLRRDAARPGERRGGDARGRAAARPRPRSPPSSTRSTRRSPRARRRSASCGRAVLRAWAEWDVRVRDPRASRSTSRRAFDTSLVGAGPAALRRVRHRQARASRSTSAAPSRAMRERGTTRSKPAASARSLTSWCTCE